MVELTPPRQVSEGDFDPRASVGVIYGTSGARAVRSSGAMHSSLTLQPSIYIYTVYSSLDDLEGEKLSPPATDVP